MIEEKIWMEVLFCSETFVNQHILSEWKEENSTSSDIKFCIWKCYFYFDHVNAKELLSAIKIPKYVFDYDMQYE